MHRVLCCAFAVILATPALAADPSKWTVKTATAVAPKPLPEPMRALLGDRTVQVHDGDKLVCEIWLRKELPVKATPQQIEKGLGYRQLDQSTLVGAIRFGREWTDFRKQKINPGVYTLRIGFQPMDGDHMGTAPYGEFCLLSPAAEDRKPALLQPKALFELSGKSVPGGSHPAVVLLFPNPKPGETPKLVAKGGGTWVLECKEPVVAGAQKTVLGFALTLAGHTTAE